MNPQRRSKYSFASLSFSVPSSLAAFGLNLLSSLRCSCEKGARFLVLWGFSEMSSFVSQSQCEVEDQTQEQNVTSHLISVPRSLLELFLHAHF